MTTFTAQVADFVALTKQNLRKVAHDAIYDVLEAAQTPQLAITKGATGFEIGKIPVAEGDLINSLTAGGTAGPASYVTLLAGFEVGETLEFRWTAPHAMRIEQGFVGTDSLGRTYNQAGRHFVGANAERFSEFVAKRVAEVSK